MNQRRVAVRGIIVHEAKLYAQRLHDESQGTTNEYWSTPGGGLDYGEDLLGGLTREIIEETGVSPKIGQLLLVQQFMSKGVEQLEFFFLIENSADFLDVELISTTHGTIEIAEHGFVDPSATHILPSLLCELRLSELTQPGVPAKIISYL